MISGIVAALVINQSQLIGVLVLTPELKKLENAYIRARSKFESDPETENEVQFVESAVKLGTAIMTSPDLPSNLKYKKSLRIYRRALAVDPDNAEASSNVEMIESIYQSLGKEVPK